MTKSPNLAATHTWLLVHYVPSKQSGITYLETYNDRSLSLTTNLGPAALRHLGSD